MTAHMCPQAKCGSCVTGELRVTRVAHLTLIAQVQGDNNSYGLARMDPIWNYKGARPLLWR